MGRGRRGSTSRGGANLHRLPKRSVADHPLAAFDPDQTAGNRRRRRAAAAKARRRGGG